MIVSVRIEKTRAHRGQAKHDFRVGPQPSYIDSEKAHLNKTLIENFGDMDSVIDEIEQKSISLNGRKWQKNSPYFINGIITFDKEYSANRDSVSIDEMDKAAKNFIDEWCKSKKVEALYLVRHGDESTPHYHFKTTVQDVTTGKSVARDMRRDDMRRMQDMAGDAFQYLGFNRGMSKSERLEQAGGDWKKANVIHRSVKQLHADLPRELEDAKARLEKNQRLYNQGVEKLKASFGEKKAKIEKNLATYQNRINTAKGELERLTGVLSPVEEVESLSFMAKKTMLGKLEEVAPVKVLKPALVQTRIAKDDAEKALRELNSDRAKIEAVKKAQEGKEKEQRERERALDERERTLTRLEMFKGRIFIGKPIFGDIDIARIELIHRLKWVDQESGWATMQNNTRLKYDTKERRATVDSEKGTSREKAESLAYALADMKSGGMMMAVFVGSAEVYAELLKMAEKEPRKYPKLETDELTEKDARNLLGGQGGGVQGQCHGLTR